MIFFWIRIFTISALSKYDFVININFIYY